MSLFSTVAAPEHDRWRIIVGGADEVLPTIRGAAMVHADPPWSYFTAPTAGQNAGDHYDTITKQTIAAHVAALYACGTDDAHLVLWSTWPKLAEWMAASAAMPWAYVSGGAWAKVGRMGIGFHWRGDSEPVLLYRKGAPKAREAISNTRVDEMTADQIGAFASVRGKHSEKPIDFLRAMVRAFCPEDGLVLDLYAGRSPLGVACVLENRPYIGIEIDPERAEIARANIAGAVARRGREQ